MPLVECPNCGHKVLSVATVCPHCAFGLAAYRKRGQIECRKCGYEISAKQADCPHCGTTSPGSRYPTWIGPVSAGAALVLIAAAAIWTQIDRFTGPPARLLEPADSAQISGEALPSVAARPVGEIQGMDVPPSRGSAATAALPVRWASTWINVREQRSGGSEIVRTFDPGQALQVDSLEDGWWAVSLDGRYIGYVADYLLLETPPQP